MSSLPKNLTLVAVGSRVERRNGDIITSIVVTDRHPWWLVWRRGVHHGRSTPDPSTTGMRRLNGALARGPRQSRLIFVGNANEASDGGSPLIELFHSRKKIEEQLRACQNFRWRGRGRKLRGL